MDFRDCQFHHVSLFSKSPPQYQLIVQISCVVTGNEPTPLNIYDVSSAEHNNPPCLPVSLALQSCG